MGKMRVPQYYKSARISTKNVSLNGLTVTVDYMDEDEWESAYTLVQQAAHNGYNVGLDEYQDLDQFKSLYADAEIFTMKANDSNNTLHAVILIFPSWFSRSLSTTLATVVIIPSSLIATNEHNYRATLRLSLDLIVELDLEYKMCVMNMFVCCLDLIKYLTAEGFKPQVLIPRAGKVQGFGVQQSYIMVKQLNVKEQQVRIT